MCKLSSCGLVISLGNWEMGFLGSISDSAIDSMCEKGSPTSEGCSDASLIWDLLMRHVM